MKERPPVDVGRFRIATAAWERLAATAEGIMAKPTGPTDGIIQLQRKSGNRGRPAYEERHHVKEPFELPPDAAFLPPKSNSKEKVQRQGTIV